MTRNIRICELWSLRKFARRKPFRTRQFYETYRNNQKMSPLVTQLPWTQLTRNFCRSAARGQQ